LAIAIIFLNQIAIVTVEKDTLILDAWVDDRGLANDHRSADMRKDQPKAPGQIDRRRLLQGAGLAIGTAGATSAATASDRIAAPDTGKPAHAGYRETEAVKTYYRAARF
jgi:hypothetical protein